MTGPSETLDLTPEIPIHRRHLAGIVLAGLGSVGALVTISACTEAPAAKTCIGDQDCDGILDKIDRTKYVADPPDADNDTLLNPVDWIPYDDSNRPSGDVSVTTAPQSPPRSPSTVRIPYTGGDAPPRCFGQPGPDKGNDGFPDYCDVVIDEDPEIKRQSEQRQSDLRQSSRRSEQRQSELRESSRQSQKRQSSIQQSKARETTHTSGY